MRVRIGSASPWGRVNHLQQITEGIAWVSTPSHGGIKLSAERNKQMPAAFKVAGGWYEEDCEASKVIAVFPDHFDPKDVDAAIKKYIKPEQLVEVMADQYGQAQKGIN